MPINRHPNHERLMDGLKPLSAPPRLLFRTVGHQTAHLARHLEGHPCRFGYPRGFSQLTFWQLGGK